MMQTILALAENAKNETAKTACQNARAPRLAHKPSMAEEYTQIMFDATPMSCNLWNQDCKMVDCNEETLRLFGLSGKEEFCERFFELSPEFQPDGRRSAELALEIVKRTFETGYMRFEWMHQKADGTAMPTEVTMVRVKHLDGYVVAGYARDLTEHYEMLGELNRAADELREARDAAQSANRAKSAFLANMSHEMRTPLNVVVGLSDLYMDAEGTPTDVLEDLKKINTAGSILLSIVNDVLDISKIEAGKFELEPMRYSTASLLNDIITLNMIRIGDKPIVFYVDIDETIPSELLGDELRLKQLFNNLLSNAFKYTQEGSVTLKVSAEKDGSDGLMLALSVSDTGIGIRPEDVEKLFTDYNQVDTRANRKIEGTGLGLSIAKRLVELMGGRISVESEYGKGSTFTAKVKQVSVSDKPLGKEVAENLRTFHYLDDKKHASSKLVRANMGYARVLVVDDLQTNLYVAEGMLKKYQMQIDCVTSGQAALERIACGKPVYDAIFLDHMMPGMDGIETAEKIRALGTSYAQSIPIISLTANAVAGAERMFLNSGFQAFLSKPIDILKLDAVLQVWVRDKAREAAIGESATVSQAEPRNLREAAGSKGAVGIPGIDGEKGLALYGHDFELYQAVLQSFAKSTPALLDGMRQVSQASLPGYTVNVHGLKGASANIAADGLRHQAERLEQAARAGNLAAVMAGNDALLHDALAIVAGIQAWLDEQGSTDAPKPRLDAPDPQLLGRLQFYSKNFDMDGVSETLDELENATYETNNDLVLWMREMADVSGFSEIAERLSEFGEVTK